MNTSQFFKWLIISWVIFSGSLSMADYLSSYQRAPRRSQLFTLLETKLTYVAFNFSASGQKVSQSNPRPACLHIPHIQCLVLMKNQLSVSYSPFRQLKISPFVQMISDSISQTITIGKFVEAGVDIGIPIRVGRASVFPSFQSVFPVYFKSGKNSIAVHQVMRFTPSIYFHFPLHRNWFPFAKVAYEFRQNPSFHHVLLGQAGFKYRDYQWELGVLAGGMMSTQHTTSSMSNDESEFYQTGEIRYYSTNPFVIGGSVWADFRMTTTDSAYIQFEFDVMGARYSVGRGVTVGYKKRLMKWSRNKQYRKKSFKFFKVKKKVLILY